jgi:hypothetical protein
MGTCPCLSLHCTMLAWRHHPLYQICKGYWTTAAKLWPRHSRDSNHVSSTVLYFLLLGTFTELLHSALSFWQVYTGLDEEWLRIGGNPVPMVIWTWWKVWTVMIPLLYLCGLALLPRQYRLEQIQRENRCVPFFVKLPTL